MQEEFRQKIARDLHDDLGQRLALLAIKTAVLCEDISPLTPELNSRFAELQSICDGLGESIRQISHELHPSTLSHLGLREALRMLVTDWGERQKLSVLFTAGRIPYFLHAEVSLCLYRISQEALRNVAKHAGVTEVRVRLFLRADQLILTVRDFGCGFDVTKARNGDGLGLISMRERVAAAGGRLEIFSVQGVGSLVRALVPHRGGTMPDVLPKAQQPDNDANLELSHRQRGV